MNKKNKDELDIDFIGGGRPLTKEDEIAISNYIRDYKAKHSRKTSKAKRVVKATVRKKVAV